MNIIPHNEKAIIGKIKTLDFTKYPNFNKTIFIKKDNLGYYYLPNSLDDNYMLIYTDDLDKDKSIFDGTRITDFEKKYDCIMTSKINNKIFVDKKVQLKVRGALSKTLDKKSLRLRFDNTKNKFFINKTRDITSYSLSAEAYTEVFSNNTTYDMLEYLTKDNEDKENKIVINHQLVSLFINNRFIGIFNLTELYNFSTKEKDYVGKHSYEVNVINKPTFGGIYSYNANLRVDESTLFGTTINLIEDMNLQNNNDIIEKSLINNAEFLFKQSEKTLLEDNSLEHIDVDSFATLFIMCDLMGLADSYYWSNNIKYSFSKNSTKLRIHMWDFDSYHGDYFWLPSDYTLKDIDNKKLDIFRKIFLHNDFKKIYYEKKRLCKNLFTEKYLFTLRDKSYINAELMIRDKIVWWRDPNVFSLEKLKNNIDNYIKYIIQRINNFYYYHPVLN